MIRALALSLAFFSAAVSWAGELDGYKFTSARLTVLNIHYNGTYEMETGSFLNFRDADEFPLSKLTIEFINPDEALRKTIEIPVRVRIYTAGLSAGGFANGGGMKIVGLKGKKINDLFGTYNGGVFGVALLANAGEMILKKQGTGIWLTDFQLGMGLRFQAAKVRLLVLPPGDFEENQTIRVIDEGRPVTPAAVTTTYEKVRDIVIP